ncbi:hypothetical protein ENBRE01_0032 [Enteropsectra breve]|nr:hypothetical protein ENBRE01_0032 [Enteropsectra breve]
MAALEQQGSVFIAAKVRSITNIAQIIAHIDTKKHKYAKFSTKTGYSCSKLSGVFKEKTAAFDVIKVTEGFIHQKLKEMLDVYQRTVNGAFEESISREIAMLRKENALKGYISKTGNIKDVESMLIATPTMKTFGDAFLFEIYNFLQSRVSALEFMQQAYLSHVCAFMTSHGKSCFSAGKERLSPKGISSQDLQNAVCEFVQIRFNADSYQIEVYESRYLWAELFVFFRIGRIDLVKTLLQNNETFFEHMGDKFKTLFETYLSGKQLFNLNIPAIRHGDCFKQFFFSLLRDEECSDGKVICSAEDFFWLKYVRGHDILKDLGKFSNPKARLLGYVLARQYSSALDLLLSSNFSLIAKYNLAREICIAESTEFAFRTLAESSDCTSGEKTMAHDNNAPVTNQLFLNFVFSIAGKMSKCENKVKFIEMLKPCSDYYEVVPKYIIKYRLYELLGSTERGLGSMHESLDEKIAGNIIEALKASGNKKEMINLFKYIDDERMIDLLCAVIEESILGGEKVNEEIILKYLNVHDGKNIGRLRQLYAFYRFFSEKTMENLKNTSIFDINRNHMPYRLVIEKVFPGAVDIVMADGDSELSLILFKTCGTLGLNEECCERASRDLSSRI